MFTRTAGTEFAELSGDQNHEQILFHRHIERAIAHDLKIAARSISDTGIRNFPRSNSSPQPRKIDYV